MLIDTHVLLIEAESRLERSLSLLEVLLFLIKQTNFDQRIDLLLDRE